MITCHTPLLTQSGKFVASYHAVEDDNCISLSINTIPSNVPIVRIHSSCLFGESFGALDCDCFHQLRGALTIIAENGHGAVIYKYQEGRGMGIENKIKAMFLQSSKNLSTAKAYDELGFPRDDRDYSVQIQALRDLGFTKIKLITANPRKANTLRQHGIEVVDELHVRYELNPTAQEYVISKQKELCHYPVYEEFDDE